MLKKTEMKCKSILIVEDEIDLLDNLAELFEIEGYSVFKTVNGQEALDTLDRLSPDNLPGCIILDLMMPVMNGYDFLQNLIREHQTDWAMIPVFVITAMGLSSPVLNNLPLAAEILLKPFRVNELLVVVRKYCGAP